MSEDEKSKRRLSVIILFAGYWVPLIILGPLSLWVLSGMTYVGFIIFWAIELVCFIASASVSKLSFKDWYQQIFLCGVRPLALTMTKLSREFVGKKEKEGWEEIFASWWGISIKYFVPFALWFLICFSLKQDLDVPYGGYHPFWQFMGWMFPALGFVGFLLPVICPPKPAEFDEKTLRIFDLDWVPPTKEEREAKKQMKIDDEKVLAKGVQGLPKSAEEGAK